jgi:hypothetical protein|tara:strand:- start:630 stop:773 length:144 start_codon:yes stop_codon:yes gene_type:complete
MKPARRFPRLEEEEEKEEEEEQEREKERERERSRINKYEAAKDCCNN